jgi:hypothetical protein
MRGERFVVLGLAHGQSGWFRDVARWSNSAAIPVEFLQCMAVEELRARLGSGRAFSAVLVDGGLPGVDRDLLDAARHVGCAVIVVGGRRSEHDWLVLGANATLPAEFDRTMLVDRLENIASRVGRGDEIALLPSWSPAGSRAPLIAVCGAPGTGASTVAMALTQGLAADIGNRALVLLADLRLDADLAALHDARDVVPGVVDLVEAHRGGVLSAAEIRSLTFRVPSRGYHLLLGLRRHRDWTVLRPRAFEAALDGLRRAYATVVADVDRDLEGEAESGSVDIEERNLMARTVTRTADSVVAVGGAGMTGILGLVRLRIALLEHGVDPARLVTVVNRAPRNPRARAEVTKTLATLSKRSPATGSLASPVFIPERRQLERVVRDVVALPASVVSPVKGAVVGVLARSGPAPSAADEPVPVTPGSLGTRAVVP